MVKLHHYLPDHRNLAADIFIYILCEIAEQAGEGVAVIDVIVDLVVIIPVLVLLGVALHAGFREKFREIHFLKEHVLALEESNRVAEGGVNVVIQRHFRTGKYDAADGALGADK